MKYLNDVLDPEPEVIERQIRLKIDDLKSEYGYYTIERYLNVLSKDFVRELVNTFNIDIFNLLMDKFKRQAYGRDLTSLPFITDFWSTIQLEYFEKTFPHLKEFWKNKLK